MRVLFQKFVLFLILFSVAVSAEYNGTINNNTANTSGIYTGIYAATYSQYCSTNSTCISGDRCITDYDGTSSGSYSGWCASSSETRCRHDDDYYGSGSSALCANTTVKRTCSSGVWNTEFCTSTHTCSSGNCSAPSSSGTGTSSPGSSNVTNVTTKGKVASLKILSVPDAEILQGSSATKTLEVKNDGELPLYNISAKVTGIDWATISPSKVDNLSINATATFIVGFVVPKSATVKTYDATSEITTSNASVKPTAGFKLKVLPTNETVETEILPSYSRYLSVLQELENNITELKNKGANTTSLENSLASIKSKLNEVNASLAAKDYFRANELLSAVGTSVEAFKSALVATEVPKPLDLVFIVIVITIVVAAAGVLAYLFWPVKDEGYAGKVTPKEKKEGLLKKLEKMLRKEKKEDNFRYDYRSKN